MKREIISNETNRLVREKNREKFIKVFVDNLDYIIDNFTMMEKNVFLSLIREMNYYNVIKLDSGLRKTIQISANISQGTSSKAINSLIEKKVLIKIEEKDKEEFKISFFTGKEYVVNPQLVGSGSFRELSRMRQVIFMDYDFDNFKSNKEITIETAYSGFDEVYNNINNHEVVEALETISDDGKTINREVIVSEKEPKQDNTDKSTKKTLLDNNKEIITKKQDIKKFNDENKKYDISIIDENKKNRIFQIERDLENYRYQAKAEVLNDISVAVYNLYFYEIDFEKRKEIAKIYDNFAVVRSGEVKDCLLGLMFQNLLDEVKN